MDGRWPLSPAEQEELRRSTEPKNNGPTVVAVAVVSAILTLVAMMALRVGILAIMNVWRNTRRRIYAKGLRGDQGINQSTLTFDKESNNREDNRWQAMVGTAKYGHWEDCDRKVDQESTVEEAIAKVVQGDQKHWERIPGTWRASVNAIKTLKDDQRRTMEGHAGLMNLIQNLKKEESTMAVMIEAVKAAFVRDALDVLKRMHMGVSHYVTETESPHGGGKKVRQLLERMRSNLGCQLIGDLDLLLKGLAKVRSLTASEEGSPIDITKEKEWMVGSMWSILRFEANTIEAIKIRATNKNTKGIRATRREVENQAILEIGEHSMQMSEKTSKTEYYPEKEEVESPIGNLAEEVEEDSTADSCKRRVALIKMTAAPPALVAIIGIMLLLCASLTVTIAENKMAVLEHDIDRYGKMQEGIRAEGETSNVSRIRYYPMESESRYQIPIGVHTPSQWNRIYRNDLWAPNPVNGTGQEERRIDTGPYANVHFKAYDCRHLRNPRRRVYDATGVNPCPNPEKDYQAKRMVKVGIVQTRVPIKVKGFRCRRWFTKRATYCGNHHLRYGSEVVEHGRLTDVSKGECLRIMHEGKFDCSADDCYAARALGTKRVSPNGTETAFTWVSQGQKVGSYCPKTVSYAYNGKVYGGGDDIGVYEETTVHILAEWVDGEYDQLADKVTFPKLGIWVEGYMRGSVLDVRKGKIFWNSRHYECTASMRALMKNVEVEIRMPVPSKQLANDAYSNSVVLLKDGTRIGGFILQSQIGGNCLSKCYETQVQNFVICLNELDSTSIDMVTNEGEPDPHLRSALQAITTFGWAESRLWAQDNFDKLVEEYCKVIETQWNAALANPGRMMRLTRLIDAKDPNSTLVREGDSGYSISHAGGAVIIEECPVIKVKLTAFSNCTQEIPAIYNGTQIFVDPVTHVVKDWPRITVCSDAYPSYYRINDEWVCSTPRYEKCRYEPTRLTPNITLDQGMQIPRVKAFTAAFYDKKTWIDADNRRRLDGAQEATIGEDVIKYTRGGTEVPGKALAFRVNTEELRTAFNAIKHEIFGGWHLFGEATIYVLGGTIVFLMLRELIGNLARIAYLVRKYGCGLWIFTCLLNLFVAIGQFPGAILKTGIRRWQRDIAMVTDDSDPDGLHARVRHLTARLDRAEAIRYEGVVRYNPDMNQPSVRFDGMSRYENVITNGQTSSFSPHANRRQSGIYGDIPVTSSTGRPDLLNSSNHEDLADSSDTLLADISPPTYPINEGEASQMLGHIQRGIQVGQQMENLINGMRTMDNGAGANNARPTATIRRSRPTGGNPNGQPRARGSVAPRRRSESPPSPPMPFE